MNRIWYFSLQCSSASLQAATAILDDEERQQSARFRFEKHRRRFIVRRAMRRIALAHELSVQPQDLQFEQHRNSKPMVLGAPNDFDFSASHSSEYGVIITGRARLGIDIESVERPIDIARFARRTFASEETEAIEAQAGEQRSIAFFNCWTAKEAYIKALGAGLQKNLQGFAVSCAPDTTPRLLWDEDAPADAPRWTLARYQLHGVGQGGYVMAVAASNISSGDALELSQLTIDSLRSAKPIVESVAATNAVWRKT